MTGDDQVELLARMYRRDREGLLRYVAEVSGLDAKLYEPMRGYSAREKDRLMQAAAFGIDFDLYLIDEDIPGVEKPFAPRYEALAQEILLSSRFVICSSSPSKIRNHCKTAALLADGSLSEIASPSEIEDVFKRSVRGANQHI
jgi:capsular polysaccharide transport system ATP-binding protein